MMSTRESTVSCAWLDTQPQFIQPRRRHREDKQRAVYKNAFLVRRMSNQREAARRHRHRDRKYAEPERGSSCDDVRHSNEVREDITEITEQWWSVDPVNTKANTPQTGVASWVRWIVSWFVR